MVPVAVVAGPALADVALEPQVTDVSRPHNNDNNNPWPGWNDTNPWANNNNHHHNHHGRGNDDRPGRNGNGWQQYVPGGIFGSS